MGKGYLYLQFLGPACLFASFMVITSGMMRGFEDTVTPLISAILILWIIRLSIAYGLMVLYDEKGIWIPIPVS